MEICCYHWLLVYWTTKAIKSLYTCLWMLCATKWWSDLSNFSLLIYSVLGLCTATVTKSSSLWRYIYTTRQWWKSKYWNQDVYDMCLWFYVCSIHSCTVCGLELDYPVLPCWFKDTAGWKRKSSKCYWIIKLLELLCIHLLVYWLTSKDSFLLRKHVVYNRILSKMMILETNQRFLMSERKSFPSFVIPLANKVLGG